jgi:hypothetical protein
MPFSTTQPQPYGGIDLHARTMSVCSLHQAGEILGHQPMKARPDAVLRTLAPYQDDLVGAVEGRFTWDWRADLCARQGLPVVLGHALSMTASPGGQATHDHIDAQHIDPRSPPAPEAL